MDKFEIIKKLMEELQESMEYGEEDFDERLGRKKPDVEIVKLSGKSLENGSEDEEDEEMEMPMDEFEDEHEKLVKTLRSPSREERMEEADEQEHELEEAMGPDEDLKRRLMRLRK